LLGATETKLPTIADFAVATGAKTTSTGGAALGATGARGGGGAAGAG